MEPIDEQLRGIEREIAKVAEIYEGIDGRLRTVEDWITERRRSIDATEQRFDRLEQVMDERFHMVEKDLDEHQSYIDQNKGEKTTWAQMLLVIGVLIAAASGVVQLIAMLKK